MKWVRILLKLLYYILNKNVLKSYIKLYLFTKRCKRSIIKLMKGKQSLDLGRCKRYRKFIYFNYFTVIITFTSLQCIIEVK